MFRSRPVPGTGSRWWCITKIRNSAGAANCSSIHAYRPRPIWPWSRSGSLESTATTVISSIRRTEWRSPKNSSKWRYPTFRESWLPGMTTIRSQSSRSRYSLAIRYSCLNPKVVRSPEQMIRSGSSSLISATARSIRLGTKSGPPQWMSEPHTFVLEEDPDGRVVEAFAPDFYLPEQGLYVELTVMKQSLVTRKNRKLRKLRERYPEVNVKLFYRRDIERLAQRYRLDLAS